MLWRFALVNLILGSGAFAIGAIVGGAFAGDPGFAQLAWAGVPFVAIGLAILRAVHTSGPAAAPLHPSGREEKAR